MRSVPLRGSAVEIARFEGAWYLEDVLALEVVALPRPTLRAWLPRGYVLSSASIANGVLSYSFAGYEGHPVEYRPVQGNESVMAHVGGPQECGAFSFCLTRLSKWEATPKVARSAYEKTVDWLAKIL